MPAALSSPFTTRAADLDAAGDHDAAVNELARGVRAGDLGSTRTLGLRLLTGNAAPLLPDHGLQMLSEAVQRGDAEAERELREIVRRGVRSFKVFLAYKGALGVDDRELYHTLRLARELATRFHDAAAAEQAIAGWQAAVTGQGDTSLLPLQEVPVPAEGLRIAPLLTAAGITPSNSEANRKLKERAVKVDGAVVEDAGLTFQPGFEGVLQVGKRNFARVRLVAA